MRNELSLQHLRRKQKDRRKRYGIWSRHQRRDPFTAESATELMKSIGYHPTPLKQQSLFEQKWLCLKSGELWFPKNCELEFDRLFEIGKRRAMHTKHPFFENPNSTLNNMGFNPGPPQLYYRRDTETEYVSYLVGIEFDESHLIKIELDINLIICDQVKAMLTIIPEWTEYGIK